MILVLGVIVQMKVKKTTSTMTHTTDSELKANFEGTRHLMPIRALFDFMNVPLQDPSVSFADNRAVSSIIESERMTPRCRHFDIPIAFLHQHKGSVYQNKLITTDKMLADMGTKPNTPALLKRFKYWGSGECFLPPPQHQHYKLLQMEYYEKAYTEILNLIKDQ